MSPTTKTYISLTSAYELFNSELPACLITMQRQRGAYGYFSSNRFANVDKNEEITDEIALNPKHFITRTKEEVLSTLVHEMVHLWQYHRGEQKSLNLLA